MPQAYCYSTNRPNREKERQLLVCTEQEQGLFGRASFPPTDYESILVRTAVGEQRVSCGVRLLSSADCEILACGEGHKKKKTNVIDHLYDICRACNLHVTGRVDTQREWVLRDGGPSPTFHSKEQKQRQDLGLLSHTLFSCHALGLALPCLTVVRLNALEAEPRTCCVSLAISLSLHWSQFLQL